MIFHFLGFIINCKFEKLPTPTINHAITIPAAAMLHFSRSLTCLRPLIGGALWEYLPLIQVTNLSEDFSPLNETKSKCNATVIISIVCSFFVCKALRNKAMVLSPETRQNIKYSVSPKVKGHVCRKNILKLSLKDVGSMIS